MIDDANQVEPGRTLYADLCIVGAGAAGISLALQFAGTGHSVLLLESGGLAADAATQAQEEADRKEALERMANRTPSDPNLRGGIGGGSVKFG